MLTGPPCALYRLVVTDMLQRRQQHSMAQAFAEWQLYVAARNDLRSIGARLAHQIRLNALKHHLAAWWQECQQQQARLYAARQQLLQNTAGRALQYWKVRPLCWMSVHDVVPSLSDVCLCDNNSVPHTIIKLAKRIDTAFMCYKCRASAIC